MNKYNPGDIFIDYFGNEVLIQSVTLSSTDYGYNISLILYDIVINPSSNTPYNMSISEDTLDKVFLKFIEKSISNAIIKEFKRGKYE